jgi:hypothetical protein
MYRSLEVQGYVTMQAMSLRKIETVFRASVGGNNGVGYFCNPKSFHEHDQRHKSATLLWMISESKSIKLLFIEDGHKKLKNISKTEIHVQHL